MFARVSCIAVTIVVLFSVHLFAQVAQVSQVSQVCIGCICAVTSGCNVSFACEGPVCGPFYITKQYWVDADKPTIDGRTISEEDEDNAYRSCSNDVYCAGRTVENYMAKFRLDCNGDGLIDCDDYVRLHRYGASGCTNALHSVYEDLYKMCIQNYQTEG